MERIANLAGDHLKGGEVEVFFALEVVIEEGLVDSGRCGDPVGAGAGQAVGAEFAEGGVENAGAGLSGAVGRGVSWQPGRSYLTN